MVDGWQKVYKFMNRIGFMQGRLSSIVDGKIQSFPWEEWEKEFERAFEIQLSIMEWTLDYQELRKNPLMTVQGREKINNLSKKYNLSIPSLTGDCFMQKPFWKTIKSDNSNLVFDLENILEASKKVGIKMILIPLVDNGKIENLTQENLFVDVCLSMQSFLKNNQMFLIFESDYPPDKLSKFIDRFPSEQYGINYDIGNSAALGFNPLNEFDKYGDRIINVHVKDRILNGNTVPLGKGNADFNLVFDLLDKYSYKGNYILQTARSKKNEHIKVINDYKQMLISWLS